MKHIECKKLSVGYNNKPVAQNIDFCVNKGDYLCILGQNGSGKTTLMKTLLGLQKSLSGELVFGDDIENGTIGYLTQQSDAQKEFPASVKEIVMSGYQKKNKLLPFYTKAQKVEAMQIMEKMGIGNLVKECYRELSGGQQQRVLLARALCATQKILFLDEPVSGLDPNISNEMYEIVQELNSKDKVTILMISHDTDTAIKYASHILKIGQVPFFGTKEQYLLHSIEIDRDGGV